MNTKQQAYKISPDQRAEMKNQQPLVIWFTGLSGSGKSTLANALEERLHALGKHTMHLDGDNMRLGLNKDLGFTPADRSENIRRIAHVAKLLSDSGLICIAAFISPFEEDRSLVRSIVGEHRYVEIYLSTPLAICESRDTKGLYAKARHGEIAEFTGISSPYEAPTHPTLSLDTSKLSVASCIDEIIALIDNIYKN